MRVVCISNERNLGPKWVLPKTYQKICHSIWTACTDCGWMWLSDVTKCEDIDDMCAAMCFLFFEVFGTCCFTEGSLPEIGTCRERRKSCSPQAPHFGWGAFAVIQQWLWSKWCIKRIHSAKSWKYSVILSWHSPSRVLVRYRILIQTFRLWGRSSWRSSLLKKNRGCDDILRSTLGRLWCSLSTGALIPHPETPSISRGSVSDPWIHCRCYVKVDMIPVGHVMNDFNG